MSSLQMNVMLVQDAGKCALPKLACHDAAAGPANFPYLQDSEKGLQLTQIRDQVFGAAG